MNRRKKKKIIRTSIVCAVFASLFLFLIITFGNKEAIAQQYSQSVVSDVMEFNPFNEKENRLDNSNLVYGKVLNKYTSAGYSNYTGEDIVIPAASYNESSGGAVSAFTEEAMAQFEELNGLEFKSGSIYVTTAATTISYEMKVTETALYNMVIDYLLPEGKKTDMLVSLTINGKKPFSESNYLSLGRLYEFFETDLFDDNGNQIRAQQRETYMWQSSTMAHPDGGYRNPYLMLLEANDEGETTTVTITLSREAGIINAIRFTAPIANPSYDEYLATNNYSEDNIYKGDAKQIQMEVPVLRDDMGPRMDWDEDYNSSPVSYDLIHYNVFGGERWSEGGQTVTWAMEVPEDGWYQVSVRYKSTLADVAVYREIKIGDTMFDGKVLFSDLEEYCFPYADGWVCEPLKDAEQNPYMFYLSAGTHYITMTSKVGPLRNDLQRLEELNNAVTSLFKKVVQITASSRSSDGSYTVDKNRDYDLYLYIPNIEEDLALYAENFRTIYHNMVSTNGGKMPYYASSISVAVELFNKLSKDVEKIPAAINDINNTLATLGTSMVSAKIQPLTVDYMMLSTKNQDFSGARSTAIESLYVAVAKFSYSFYKDYAEVGVIKDPDVTYDKEISCFVSSGRENFEMIRTLVTEDFTVKHNIKVDLQMVPGAEGLLMLRYIAGTAPDMSITIGGAFDFAYRGALLPLTDLDNDGVDENLDNYMNLLRNGGVEGLNVAEGDYDNYAFNKELIKSYLWKGQYYAFPETAGWSALFYRTDILNELGLSVPNTWDEVYTMLPILQEAGYDFYYGFNEGNYYPFLFQHGGTYYTDDGMDCSLDTQVAFDAYKEYSDLYIKYKMTLSANFYQRFRNGDIPIGLADMGTYCTLSVSAPELAGKWAISPIPGHYIKNEETGEMELNRATSNAGSCAIIMSSTPYDRALSCWEFIEWWSSAETEANYGQEVEITFGVASRYNPANQYALSALPYTQAELDVILEQWSNTENSVAVLGGYYTSRYLMTAFNKTVLQGKNARICLEDAIKEINKEMKRKQAEYNVYDSITAKSVE